MSHVSSRKEREDHRRAAAEQELAPGDRILGGAKVVVASQAGRGGPLTAAAVTGRLTRSGSGIGKAIGRMSTLTGTPGSLALTFPPLPTPAVILYVSRRELLATRGITEPRIVWRVPVERIVDVRRSPRLQVMARFRVSFDDDSSLVFLTFRARTVHRIREWLGIRHVS